MILSSRSSTLLPLILAVCSLCQQTSEGATVTVDPGGTPTPGSVYLTLTDAQNNLETGDAWGNGNSDTILLATTTPHIVREEVDVDAFGTDPATTLTIRSAGPGPALIVGDAFSARFRLFNCEDSGTYIYEDLTVIGGPGLDGVLFEYRAAFRVEVDDPGEITNVHMRNCVVTRNDGSNQPVMDYSQSFPAGNEGVYMRALYSGDDRYRGRFSILAENCVFAYLTHGTQLAREIERTQEPVNPFSIEEATRVITFRKCLFANNKSDCLRVNASGPETSITFEDCLLTLTTEKVVNLNLQIATSGANNPPNERHKPNLKFVHTILDCQTSTQPPISNGSSPFGGVLELDDVTSAGSPGLDMISLANQPSASGTIDLRNIVAFGVNSVLRLQPDPTANSGPTPAALSAASLATNNAVLGTQAPSVQATLNSAVVTSADPQFLSTTATGLINSLRLWDSTQNNLFDIDNGSYLTLGQGGGPLRGGAEVTGAVGIRDWSLY